ncbi:MAG: tRNA (adenosine(37)-N6)-threonylcarbamoyltransferase complex transferase subunit TsaD [Candidatus Liptonbacteria bacterium]
MLILAIETSCDETALALVRASGTIKTGPSTSSGRAQGLPKFEILKEEIASQVDIHRPFGGVVPNLAKREHQKNLPLLLEQIFGKERIAKGKGQNHKPHAISHTLSLRDVDAIAVTVGPGLEPALWQGIVFAQELGKKYKKPVIGVNHLEGHLYSFLLPREQKRIMNYELRIKGKEKFSGSIPNSQFLIPNSTPIFPAVALIVSGGHTILLSVKNIKSWKRLGETRDDAAGEAFDKVARILKLPYPGGPEIQKLVEKLPKNWKDKINFPRPMLNNKDYDFSFSGLKTAVLYYMRDKGYSYSGIATGVKNKILNPIPKTLLASVAGAFSAAATDVLVKKTMRAAADRKAKSVLLSGGVAANRMLRERLGREAGKNGMRFFVAEHKYNTDNAVMIAVAGYMNILRKKKPARPKLGSEGGLKLEADGLMSI